MQRQSVMMGPLAHLADPSSRTKAYCIEGTGARQGWTRPRLHPKKCLADCLGIPTHVARFIQNEPTLKSGPAIHFWGSFLQKLCSSIRACMGPQNETKDRVRIEELASPPRPQDLLPFVVQLIFELMNGTTTNNHSAVSSGGLNRSQLLRSFAV